MVWSGLKTKKPRCRVVCVCGEYRIALRFCRIPSPNPDPLTGIILLPSLTSNQWFGQVLKQKTTLSRGLCLWRVPESDTTLVSLDVTGVANLSNPSCSVKVTALLVSLTIMLCCIFCVIWARLEQLTTIWEVLID